MRAIVMQRHGPPEVLEYKENANAPKRIPGSRQVKVEIAGAGLNPVDFKMRIGPISDFMYPKPKIPGSDMAGRVVEVPEGSSFHVGQKVYGMLPLLGSHFGAYAQYCCVDESILATAPESIPLIDCAVLPLVACTILQGLRPVRADYGDANLKGKKCFVSAGSGGVGTFAIQFCAKVLGMEVATSCSPRNFELVRSLGASVVLDYHNQQIPDHIHQYDVFIDCLGYMNEELVFAQGATILNSQHSHYIRIASSPYGAQKDRVPAYGSDPLGMSVPEARFDRIVHGLFRQSLSQWFSYGIRYHFVLVVPDKSALEEVRQVVDRGLIVPVIQQRFPLAEAAAAQTMLEESHVTGKLVLVVNDQL
jgi:alcohol dehydrogenase